MNRISSFLLFAIFPLITIAQTNGNRPIKSSRTTIYEAVAKDTTYTTGAIIANFHYIRYDELGRIWIERQVNNKGETVVQMQHAYNEDHRVVRQIITSQKMPFRDYRYRYDEQGRLIEKNCLDSVGNSINHEILYFHPDGKCEKLIHEYNIVNDRGELMNDKYKIIDTYIYDGDGKLIKVSEEQLIKGVPRNMVREAKSNDKRPLRLQSDYTKLDFALGKDFLIIVNPEDVSEEKMVKESIKEFEYDCYGNWIKRTQYSEDIPQSIALRTIDYDTLTTHCQQLDLQHNVKSVKQTSYKAIHKGPGSIDKGAKQGIFYTYEFDADGRKIKEDHFSEVGVKLGSTQYVYNDNHQIIKENRKDANGKLLQTIDWNYDAQGLLKSKALKTADGATTHKGVFHYDVLKNCVAQIWYAKDGTKCAEMAYIYDGFGKLIEEQLVLKPEIDLGMHFNNVKRKWNSRGRIVEELIENANGEIILSTYKYNKNGMLIGGSEIINNNPAIDYVYKFYNDEHGNWKKKVKFVNGISTVYEERQYVYYN